MSNTLPETIHEAIVRHDLIPSGTNVVVGVSGGADSVALLRAFQTLEIPCTVAHLNHRLRGAESDADEQFVRNLAGELGLPMVGTSVDVKSLAAESGLSLEMAARKARHDFFAEFENSVIALAHHADDQAETFILRLARGAGTDGLAGMSYAQTIGNLNLIRPMLNIPRVGILQWLTANEFEWREDATNSDELFLRNKVRHTILPMLENELNPNIRATILRTMEILRDENEWMEQLETGSLKFETRTPLAAKRRAVRKWLFEQGAEEADFGAVETILELMERAEGSKVYELNRRQRVVVEYGVPRFEQMEFQSLETGWNLTIEEGSGWKKDHGKGAGRLPAQASVNAGKVGDALIEVRGWRPGDRMQPLGMEGSRKLQDIFTDQKVPKARRPRIPVVVCRGEIIWLPGYRTARGWEVRNDDDKSLHLHIEQNGTG